MKRLRIGYIVILAAAILLFAACSKKEAAKTVDPNAPVTLTVWAWDPRNNIYSMNKAAEIYRRDHPNVTVNALDTADINQKLITALSSNQTSSLPDIILTQDWDLQKNIITFPDAFVPIDEKIDPSQFAQYKVEKGTVNGKTYGVPFDNAVAACFLRRDYVEQAGLKVEDFNDITWERFIELGKIVKAKTGHAMFPQVWTTFQITMLMLQSTGSWYFEADGKPNLTTNPTLRRGIELIKEMIDEGVILMVNDNTARNAAINNGTLAAEVQGNWIMATMMAEQSQEGKWAMVSVPRFSNIPGALNASNMGGSSWQVLASSKNVDVALDFLSATFAGSTELYDDVMDHAGYIPSWLPAGKSDVYSKPHPFFGGQKIFEDLIKWSELVPRTKYGVYNSEARDAVTRTISDVMQGKSIDQALDTAQKSVEFLMAQ